MINARSDSVIALFRVGRCGLSAGDPERSDKNNSEAADDSEEPDALVHADDSDLSGSDDSEMSFEDDSEVPCSDDDEFSLYTGLLF
jgi:hypothetical protein